MANTTQITDDIRKTATDTGYAVVGLTDLAVERVRSAQARAEARREAVRAELKLKKIQGRVQQAPTAAVAGALEAAGKVEERYEDLTVRGRDLVERIRNQRATQDLVRQGRSTLSRTKSAVTVGRKAVSDTNTSAKGTATTAKKQAEAAAEETKSTATKRAQATKSAAKRTSTTARKRTAATSSATKGTATSAKKTATQAAKATEAAAEKVGD